MAADEIRTTITNLLITIVEWAACVLVFAALGFGLLLSFYFGPVGIVCFVSLVWGTCMFVRGQR